MLRLHLRIDYQLTLDYMRNYIFGLVGLMLCLGSLTMPAYAQDVVGVDATTNANIYAVSNHSVQTMVAGDTNITNVALSKTSVGITYPVQAKLFGIFPLTLTAHTEIANDGSVSIQYPWYTFLFSSNQAQVETKLKAIGQVADTWNTDSLSGQQQLALLALVHSAFKSSFESTASTSKSIH